jgi:hypothetical protein
VRHRRDIGFDRDAHDHYVIGRISLRDSVFRLQPDDLKQLTGAPVADVVQALPTEVSEENR